MRLVLGLVLVLALLLLVRLPRGREEGWDVRRSGAGATNGLRWYLRHVPLLLLLRCPVRRWRLWPAVLVCADAAWSRRRRHGIYWRVLHIDLLRRLESVLRRVPRLVA